jgi:AcrR family transcriptional regulator
MAAKKAVQSPRERRVTKVLDAAQELFATRGYEATLVAEIAESPSVAPATIYNYFSTKPNLLMELAFAMFARRCPSAERSSKICLKTRFKALKPSSACSRNRRSGTCRASVGEQ